MPSLKNIFKKEKSDSQKAKKKRKKRSAEDIGFYRWLMLAFAVVIVLLAIFYLLCP